MERPENALQVADLVGLGRLHGAGAGGAIPARFHGRAAEGVARTTRSDSRRRNRSARMFGAMPCTASDSSPKRRGPGSSASTSSRLHRSPTRSRAAARGEGAEAMAGSYGIGLDIRLTSSNLRIASHTLPLRTQQEH